MTNPGNKTEATRPSQHTVVLTLRETGIHACFFPHKNRLNLSGNQGSPAVGPAAQKAPHKQNLAPFLLELSQMGLQGHRQTWPGAAAWYFFLSIFSLSRLAGSQDPACGEACMLAQCYCTFISGQNCPQTRVLVCLQRGILPTVRLQVPLSHCLQAFTASE